VAQQGVAGSRYSALRPSPTAKPDSDGSVERADRSEWRRPVPDQAAVTSVTSARIPGTCTTVPRSLLLHTPRKKVAHELIEVGDVTGGVALSTIWSRCRGAAQSPIGKSQCRVAVGPHEAHGTVARREDATRSGHPGDPGSWRSPAVDHVEGLAH